MPVFPFSLTFNTRHTAKKRAFLSSLLVFCMAAFFNLPIQAAAAQSSEVKRIISLSPHLTEWVYSAGAGHKLVGVSAYSDYPAAAKTIPVVGGYDNVNIEKIISLKPDLILTWSTGNNQQNLKKLQQLNIPIFSSHVNQLKDIPQLIRIIGEKANTQHQANKVAKALDKKLAALQHTYQNAQPIQAFYQVWDKPYITINGKQFISKAIQICGGKNIFADLPSLSAEISLESVFSRDPQIIFLGGFPAKQTEWQEHWRTYPSLQAVRNKQIYALNSDHFQRPTARLINNLNTLCQAIDKARQYYP